jgi:hypothetical protein
VVAVSFLRYALVRAMVFHSLGLLYQIFIHSVSINYSVFRKYICAALPLEYLLQIDNDFYIIFVKLGGCVLYFQPYCFIIKL